MISDPEVEFWLQLGNVIYQYFSQKQKEKELPTKVGGLPGPELETWPGYAGPIGQKLKRSIKKRRRMNNFNAQALRKAGKRLKAAERYIHAHYVR